MLRMYTQKVHQRFPVTNFTANFSKLGYSAIKALLDKNQVNYSGWTIQQASDLKQKLETLNISCDKTTIISLDIENMYPSIKYGLVKKAIDYFTSLFTPDEKATIEVCCWLIQFGMGSTLLCFKDGYYEYNGGESIEEKGLAIGGYESAFLADLVAAYLLELTKDNFYLACYYGIYRDDGIVVFHGNWTTVHIAQWLERFQSHVNTIVGNTHLIFTASVWTSTHIVVV